MSPAPAARPLPERLLGLMVLRLVEPWSGKEELRVLVLALDMARE